MAEPRGQRAERIPAVHITIATKISGRMISLFKGCSDTTVKSMPGDTVIMTVSGKTTTRDDHAVLRLIGKIRSEYCYPTSLKTKPGGVGA